MTIDHYTDEQLAQIASGEYYLDAATARDCVESLAVNSMTPWPGTTEWDELPGCLVMTAARLAAGQLLLARKLGILGQQVKQLREARVTVYTPEPPNLNK